MNSTPILRSLKFAVGYDCNLKCGFCLQQLSDKAPILDFGIVDKVMAEEMVKRDLRLVTLTGGEPTFDPYRSLSLKIVRLAYNLGKETCIFSNGVLLDESLLGEFSQAGLTRFRISLYDPIDGEQIKKLMQRLGLFGFPKMGKYTVTRENFDNLPETLAQFASSGIDWLQIKPYNRIEDPIVDQKYELTSDQVLSMSAMLLEFRFKHPQIKLDLLPLCYEFLVDPSIPTESLSLCHCGKGERGYLVIGPTGDVRICGAYPDPIGNAKVDSITELWQNHPLLGLVRGLAARTKPKECGDCNHWEKCAATDCHSATFAKYGDFRHGNPQCPILSRTSC